MFYIIVYENNVYRHGHFNSWREAVNYAESNSGGYDYTIDRFKSENDYFMKRYKGEGGENENHS